MPRNAIRRSTRIAEALPTGAVPPPPPKKRKRIRRRPSTPPQPAPDPAAEERYGNTVDPAAVTRPVEDLVHPSLSRGWMVSSDLSMCFIFDAVSPARRFKRGTLATPDGDFANYGRKPYMDLTETDGPPPGWVQYKPPIIVQQNRLECSITYEKFMTWEPGELRNIRVKAPRQRRGAAPGWANRKIPAPYDRIVAQFLAEEAHSKGDNGHESVRRQSYVSEVLSEFTKELLQYDGPDVAFRSKVLTPILQRQLWGVHDAYAPMVRDAILDDGDEDETEGDGNGEDGAGDESQKKLTIRRATSFYLSEDPTDPGFIPTYRRNLIYIPEARWHLASLLQENVIGDKTWYKGIRDHHSALMRATNEIVEEPSEEGAVPKFTPMEVNVLVSEGIETFFGPELERVPESLAVCLERRAAALAAMTAAGAAGVVVPAAPAQPNTTDPSGT